MRNSLSLLTGQPNKIFASRGTLASRYKAGGVIPRYILDARTPRYFSEAIRQDELTDIVTHTRASTATYVDATGTIQTAAANVPRVGHHVWNGSAWVNEGLLYESEARTNLLLNSGTLATQSVTVTAAPHTLHFTGTGTVTLSGVSTDGPLVGTGTGENNRAYLTFTPTAGTLTLTVSGTVSNAQLEAAPTPSSYIPTAGSTVTRAADVLTIPAANLPWNPLAVSIQMEGRVTYADTDKFGEVRFFSWGLFPADQIRHDLDTNGSDIGQFRSYQLASSVDSSVTGPIDSYSPGVLVPFNLAGRHGSTFVNGAVDGTALTANTTPTALPDLSDTNLLLGQAFMGTVRTFRMWGTDIGDAGIEEASA